MPHRSSSKQLIQLEVENDEDMPEPETPTSIKQDSIEVLETVATEVEQVVTEQKQDEVVQDKQESVVEVQEDEATATASAVVEIEAERVVEVVEEKPEVIEEVPSPIVAETVEPVVEEEEYVEEVEEVEPPIPQAVFLTEENIILKNVEVMLLNGDKYKGTFEGDKPAGHGTYTSKDGSCYQGMFRDGLMHGIGEHKQNNNEVYRGSFKIGIRHGQGALFINGNEQYSGMWKEGKRNGRGSQVNEDGTTLFGVWINDVYQQPKVVQEIEIVQEKVEELVQEKVEEVVVEVAAETEIQQEIVEPVAEMIDEAVVLQDAVEEEVVHPDNQDQDQPDIDEDDLSPMLKPNAESERANDLQINVKDVVDQPPAEPVDIEQEQEEVERVIEEVVVEQAPEEPIDVSPPSPPPAAPLPTDIEMHEYLADEDYNTNVFSKKNGWTDVREPVIVPLNIQQFYDELVSDDAVFKFQDLCVLEKHQDVQATKWKDNKMQIKTIVPLKGVPFVTQTRSTRDITMLLHTEDKMVIELKTVVQDAPYGDTFVCLYGIILCSKNPGEPKSILMRKMKVDFVKYTMFRSKIQPRAELGVLKTDTTYLNYCQDHGHFKAKE